MDIEHGEMAPQTPAVRAVSPPRLDIESFELEDPTPEYPVEMLTPVPGNHTSDEDLADREPTERPLYHLAPASDPNAPLQVEAPEPSEGFVPTSPAIPTGIATPVASERSGHSARWLSVTDYESEDDGSEAADAWIWRNADEELFSESGEEPDEVDPPTDNEANGPSGMADTEALVKHTYWLVGQEYPGDKPDEWDNGWSPVCLYSFFHVDEGTRHWAVDEHADEFICGTNRTRHVRGGTAVYHEEGYLCKRCVRKAQNDGWAGEIDAKDCPDVK